MKREKREKREKTESEEVREGKSEGGAAKEGNRIENKKIKLK